MNDSKPRPAHIAWAILLIIGITCFATASFAEASDQQKGTVKHSDHAEAPPLRDTAPLKEKDGQRDKPIRLLGAKNAISSTPDTAVQSFAVSAPTVGNVVSFDGLGVGGGYTPNAAPPDTNGAVGDTQYVQWVNESFAVYSKSGTLLYGPAAGNTLFQALGASHPCAVNNDGDPIAQYDKAAKRWVMTQFSVTNGASIGYWQCVAVSKGPDAHTSGWNVYAFRYSNFNDYPKLGVWNNGYYITFNMFAGNTFVGPQLCAYDRSAMLAGTPANEICFQLGTAYGGVLPADLDGSTPPPANSPAYFVDFGANSLEVWKMTNVNFSVPSATLSGPVTVPVTSFSAACGGGGTCIPQLSTSQLLDSLADRLMYRLAYRNFGGHEALVVNHSVTAGSSVGVRWYELRDLGNAAPTVYQQGTYAPDASYRWMGSAAMDNSGNLAVGYSVSSSSIYPGIRFAGRAPGDPLGTLSSEITIKDGTGAQLRTLNRWGDYSSISVDPVDDCTLWYTTEYLQSSGTFNWSTRIGNFKFAGCGQPATPDFSISATPASESIATGTNANYTVNVAASGGFVGAVGFTVSGLPAGANAGFNPPTVTGSGSSALTISNIANGTYTLTITGTSGTLTHSTTVSLQVGTPPPPPDFTITASPSSQTVLRGSSTTYGVTITGTNNFTGTVSFAVSGLPSRTTASFTPSTVTGSGTSTLKIATGNKTSRATYSLTITGSSGSLSHSTGVSLTVK